MSEFEPPSMKYSVGVPMGDGLRWLWGVPVEAVDPLTRRRTYTQHALFTDTQRVARASASQAELNEGLIRLSHRYRAAFQEDLLTFRRLQSSPGLTAAEGRRLEERRMELAVLDAVWHLAELLLLEDAPAVGPRFVAWVAHHTNQPSVARLQTAEPRRMHHHPEYWTVVKSLLCTGQTVEALRLLDLFLVQHEQEIQDDPRIGEDEREEDRGAFTNLRVLIESKPSLLRMDPQQFRLRFDRWQADCDEGREYLIRVFEKRCAFPLLDILLILSGDEKMLKSNCRTWFELAAAYIEFVCPEVARSRLEDLVVKCMADMFKFSGEESGISGIDAILDSGLVSNLDKVFFMVVTSRVPELMQACDQLFPQSFNAHLADLLYHRGAVGREPIPPLDIDAREYFLLRHAAHLAADDEYWTVALDYFAQCPVQGGDHIAAMLDHMDLSDEGKADRVFAHLDALLASSAHHRFQARDLQHVQAAVDGAHRSLGRAHAAGQQYIPSILHFLKAQSYADLQFVAEELVEGFTRSFLGNFNRAPANHTAPGAAAHLPEVLRTLSDLIEMRSVEVEGNAGYAMETLLSLHKLWKAHEDVQRRDYLSAAKELMALIENPALPRRLWMLLLVQAIPLCEQSAFSTPQVFRLMTRLEELTLSYKAAEYRQGISDRMMGTIRLALVNNLRRAFLAAPAAGTGLPAPTPIPALR